MFLDFVAGSENKIKPLVDAKKVIGIGIVNGRNVWVNDIRESVKFLEGIAEAYDKDKILVGSSCSLLHVPFTLKYEEKMDSDIKSWLSYAVEKLNEIKIINKLFRGVELDAEEKS